MKFEDLKVGDEVAVSSSSRFDVRYSFNWHVTKITPSGQITVQKDYPVISGREPDVRRFNKRGIEMGDHYHPAYLEVGAERLASCKKMVVVGQLRISAAGRLNQVRLDKDARNTWSTESMVRSIAELEEKLANAKAAVAKLVEINAD